jgi:ribokinase
MKPKITVVGSSNVDLILKIPRLPKPGETVLGGEFSTVQGGKGANQAVAAARAGGDVQFVSRVGIDDLGKNSLAAYAKDNLNLEYCVTDETASNGVALIFVNAKGENSIGVASGANGNLDRKQVRNAAHVIESSALVLVQLETPIESVEEAITIAAVAGVPIILNPAPAQILDDNILKSISILTPNETETEILTGISLTSDEQIRRAAQSLREKGVGIVIVTLGARGVYVSSSDMDEFIPGFTVESVDTTGAGDIFNGALAVAVAEGKPLSEAIRFANAAAALSVTKLGAQPSAHHRNDIEHFLRTH